MFNPFKRWFQSEKKISKQEQLYAPVNGQLVSLDQVPDIVFSQRVVGDGIAIDPSGDTIVAPVNGTIGKIFEANHAFSILSEQGLEIFVHFGIDTVELKGSGFSRLATENQQVTAGTPILRFDLAFLKANARSLLTPIVISNMECVQHLQSKHGEVCAGVDEILSIQFK